MIYAGGFAAAILAAKPQGAALASFPLAGLPMPAFTDALKKDAINRLFAAWLSLAEAMRDLRSKRATWPAVKLYYSCYYSLESLLAADSVVTFRFNGDYFIGDSVTGTIKKTGRSSHQINWNVFLSLTRLNRWAYGLQSGDAYAQVRSFREDASYNSAFADPALRPEMRTIELDRITRTYHQYKSDGGLFYTFLEDHIALAYPIRLAFEAATVVLSAGLSLSLEQKEQLRKVCPVAEPLIW